MRVKGTMETSRYRPAVVRKALVGAVMGLLLLAAAACSGTDGAGGQGDPSSAPSSGTSSSVPAPEDSAGGSLPTTPPDDKEPGVDPTKGNAVTLQGTVEEGVESGCLVLTANGKMYGLFGGDRNIVKAGATVEVTGHEAPDIMSFCQQGIPFQVESARAL